MSSVPPAKAIRARRAPPPVLAADADDPLWYKDAIIYQTHVKAFMDSSHDGVGDFAGLTARLDYIRELGVSAIWLLPFYPSPQRDDGYDIADYRKINPAYGSMKDFRTFVKEAHRRGLRVITELVINHTSDQHPWFQRARKDKPGGRWRDWYVWSDDDGKWPETRIIFTDTEKSNWSWDEEAGAYYWHRFFSHQPDLNFDNPEVLAEVVAVMRMWLDMGVDGLRLDAIPYLVERDGTNNENLPETHDVLKKLRTALDENHPKAFFLAEANQWPEDTRPYFGEGEGDECHMAFHFPLMPRLYMGMAMEDRYPITDILRQTPEIPERCQWAVFLRNHDELTLEMVTAKERDFMWEFYARDQRARINLGIRRRLAPLMDNDRRKIELMNSLLFSMPGTPVVYYGDEIGMGDNFFLGDRNGVRTPMQWSPDRNGGFSKADPNYLYLPALQDPIYGYEAVNVEAQARSPSSLLNWMRRIMAVRQAHKAFGRGQMILLYPGNRKVLAYLREYADEQGQRDTILCLANLSRQAQAVELDLSAYRGHVPVELLGRSAFPPVGDLPYLLTLPAYAFYWFKLTEEAEVPSWHREIPHVMPDLTTVVLRGDLTALAEGPARKTLEAQVLPDYLSRQRWFAAKDQQIEQVEIARALGLPLTGRDMAALVIEVTLKGRKTPDTYFLPVLADWDEAATQTGAATLPWTIAKLRKGPTVGALTDAAISPDLARAVLAEFARGGDGLAIDDGTRLLFSPGAHFADLDLDIPAEEIAPLGVEQSNSSIRIGDVAILKIYRKLAGGVHPELEIGAFLTDIAGFANIPAQLGKVEQIGGDGKLTALAVLQAFVRNQGDGWRFTTDYLAREIEEARLADETMPFDPAERFSWYEARAATLGTRIAELHRAFAMANGDPAFDPEPMEDGDWAKLREAVIARTERAFALIDKEEAGDAATAAAITQLQKSRRKIDRLIEQATAGGIAINRTRHHGDLHLGQVLVADSDFMIVDFEGEPARSLAERRAKACVLRDVAGMIRSYDYAAWAAMFAASPEGDGGVDEAVAAIASDWRDRTVAAFLDAYFKAIGDCPSVPADRDAARLLIDLFTLEKAMYEIGYEAANRPDWLKIPILGAAGLVR